MYEPYIDAIQIEDDTYEIRVDGQTQIGGVIVKQNGFFFVYLHGTKIGNRYGYMSPQSAARAFVHEMRP